MLPSRDKLDPPPVKRGRLEFTAYSSGELFSENSPLSETLTDFCYEVRLLANAVGNLERMLDSDGEYAGGDLALPSDCGEFRKHTLHLLGYQVMRLHKMFPTFAPMLPDYHPVTPEAGGVVGETYCRVVFKLGLSRWSWFRNAVPIDMEDELLTLSDYSKTERVAHAVDSHFRWFCKNRPFEPLNHRQLMEKLQIEFNRAIQGEKPKPTAPVVSLDPPQITIGGTAIALSDDQALYLQELLKADDWMSDPEFKKRCQQVGNSARPDRWRDKLPEAVSRHLDTDHRGTRWKHIAD